MHGISPFSLNIDGILTVLSICENTLKLNANGQNITFQFSSHQA
jgi:hypothetical protein